MNSKIFIILYVPLIEKKYEMFIPINKRISVINKLITNSIFGGILNRKLYMYDKVTGNIIDESKYVKDCGLTNSSEIILI